MKYGIVVVGPPGSGKSTCTAALGQLYGALNRKHVLVNLDPAAEHVSYTPDIDVRDLVDLATMAEVLRLGPNGALLCAMQYVLANLDWLVVRLNRHLQSGTTVVIDFPGQGELWTHDETAQRLLARLQKECEIRMCAVHLVDAVYCADPGAFLAVCMCSLGCMMRLELPHINVLSKCDLLPQHKWSFDFDPGFYASGQGLENLVTKMPRKTAADMRKKKLAATMVEVLADYSLVSFAMLGVENKKSMLALVRHVDKALGFSYGNLDFKLGDIEVDESDFEFAANGAECLEGAVAPQEKEHGLAEPDNHERRSAAACLAATCSNPQHDRDHDDGRSKQSLPLLPRDPMREVD
eukprot:ANDGO_06197.mRNA.1 GPN-loop GTPase 2 homolog